MEGYIDESEGLSKQDKQDYTDLSISCIAVLPAALAKKAVFQDNCPGL